ncbi:MAG: DUF417 family protein [Phycisphaera sp.]|nr:MAG: DUF417 family protein [Phycisphaera sp.]
MSTVHSTESHQTGETPRDIALTTTQIGTIADRIGAHATRYGMVLVIGWIGAMKFTAYEAEGISGLVQNSPLMSWMYNILSVRGFASGLGAAELVIAGMIAAGPWFRRIGAVGALLAVGMFATTLSFMLSTPGVFEPSLGGFPALSIAPGQFLLKDAVLLGASIWLLGNSLKTHRN